MRPARDCGHSLNSCVSFIRVNLLETDKAILEFLLMTKNPASRYIKPGLGFLDHLAEAHGLGTKSHGPRIVEHPPTFPPSVLHELN
jgi:hypothetical protein